MILDHLAKQFRYRVIMGLSAIACLAIAPMAALRFYNGDWLIALVDAAIVLAIILNMVAVYRGVDPDRVGLFGAITVTSGVAVVSWMDLPNGVPWIHAVIIANSMLAGHRVAVPLSLLLVVLPLLHPDGFANAISALGFFSTALMVLGFSTVHSMRSDQQGRQLEALALLDPLTNIGNRRALLLRLKRMAATASGTSLLLFDLDEFKRINDTWGHEQGDEVLRRFAMLLQQSGRDGDEMFRLGGEEFVLVLPGTPLQQARDLAEHLLEAVQRQLVVGEDRITVSIGVAQGRTAEAAEQWLARVDALMYRAKRLGRNRVVAESDADVA
ncbi:MAG: GGDEF domain-containing protein [Pseudoxanthomonas suwonensis]|nr:GGDEF domain-containing protein [Pseudoxanthomonas suwonensis]